MSRTTGKSVNGVRDADSPKLLRQLLRKDGVLVTSFELSKGGKAAPSEQNAKKGGLSRDVDLGGLFGGVKKIEIAAFTRQMSTLLALGHPARRVARRAGRADRRTSASRRRSSEVRTAVNEGSSLADALAKHPKLFDELFVSMVRAGEVAGNLDEVLDPARRLPRERAEAQVEGPGRDDLSDRHGRRRRRHHGAC